MAKDWGAPTGAINDAELLLHMLTHMSLCLYPIELWRFRVLSNA